MFLHHTEIIMVSIRDGIPDMHSSSSLDSFLFLFSMVRIRYPDLCLRDVLPTHRHNLDGCMGCEISTSFGGSRSVEEATSLLRETSNELS